MVQTTLKCIFILAVIWCVLADASKRSKKIINGFIAGPHAHPYHAVIVTSDGIPYCGGAIIGKHFILTAAHCETEYTSTSSVVVGAHNILDYEKTGQKIPIKEFVPHEKYRDETLNDDIGLIYLEQPINLHGPYAKKIELSRDLSYPKHEITITGWGVTDWTNNIVPELLQRAELNIFPFEYCQVKWSDWGFPDSGFCYGNKEELINTCSGDSGGPVVQKVNEKYVLVGVHNFGSFTCSRDRPSAALMVSKYLDWIEKTKTATLSKHGKRKKIGSKKDGKIQHINVSNSSQDVYANKKQPDRRKKIIGGKNATRHAYPYQVVFLNNERNPYCGGAIIDKQFIITAAHCKGSWIDTSIIVAGVHDYSNYSKTGQERNIKKYVQHEGYEEDELHNDIAIIFVDKPFEYNDYVKNIELPTTDSYPSGKLIATGWGRTKSGDANSKPYILQETELDVLSRDKCVKMWKPIPFPEYTFCAARIGTDICDGDSGGPIVQVRQNGQYELAGVVNFSSVECNNSDKPAVFAWVAQYLDWIEEQKSKILKRATLDASRSAGIKFKP